MASLTYRGYRWENIDYIPAPVGGWNTDTVPWLLPANQAPILDNFIVRPGNLKARGPICGVAQRLLTSSDNKPIGAAPAATPMITQANPFANGLIGIAPWDCATIQAPNTAPFQKANAVYAVSPAGVSQSLTFTDQETAPGPRWINFDGTLYGLGITSTTLVHDAPSSYNIPATRVLSTSAIGGNSLVKVSKKMSGTETIAFTGGGVALTGTSTQIRPTSGTLAAGATTQTATITNLGLNIPTSATVLGIEFIVEELDVLQGNAPSSFCSDANMVLVGVPGTPTSQSNGSQWFGADETYTTYGSPNNPLWGAATVPTPTQVNATAFGISFNMFNSGSATGEPFAGILQVNIYYAASGSAPVVPTKPWATTGPSGAVDIASYLGRIWLAQGVDVPGSGSTHSSTTIFWTNPVTSTSPLAFTAADWKNPASGLTNQNVIDHNTSDPIMGFAPMRNCMVVFRRNSVYVLRGTTESNFTLTKVSGVYGCLDPRSIQVVDSLTYFVSKQGLCATDGTRVTNVSGGVQFSMMDAITIEQNNVVNGISGTTGWISTGLTQNGQIILSIGYYTLESSLAGQMQTLWSGMYDPQVTAWTRITSSIWSSNNYGNIGTSPGMPAVFFNTNAGSNIGLWEVGNGEVSVLEHAVLGFSFVNDYQTMDRNFNGINSPGGGGPLNQYVGIQMRWVSKIAGVIGTSSLARRRAQPKRFFLDHVFAGQSLRSTTVSGTIGTDNQMLTSWQVKTVHPGGFTTTYDTAAILQASRNATTLPTVPYGGLNVMPEFQALPSRAIQRDNQDFLSEIDDVMFEVTLFPLPNPSGIGWFSWVPASFFVGEIYGVGIEYQSSHDVRQATT